MNNQNELPPPTLSQRAPEEAQVPVDPNALPATADFASKAQNLLEDHYPHHEGVDHGPYVPAEGDEFSQSRGLAGAVIKAYEAGRIDGVSKDKLEKGLDGSIDAEFNHAVKDTEGMDDEAAISKATELVYKGSDVMSMFRHEAQELEAQWADDYSQQEDASEDDIDDYFDTQDDYDDYHDREDEYDDEDTEDPLAGDVDRWVHPDETRTDAQIAHDEKYAVRPYGKDPVEDYWDEYDELIRRV
jgi:hypothetical protein